MDSIVRSKQEPVKEAPVPVGKVESQSLVEDHVEVPYTDAPNFLEDYFGLGTKWKDADAMFDEDLHKIDTYISDLIQSGEIANSQKAVKDIIKRMEKLNNLTKEERAVVKLEVLGNYAEFLTKNQTLKSNLKRYAN